MTKRNFYNIIKTEELHVSILEKSHFSIGTSPYYAHQYGLAVDIYQKTSLENYKVSSPVAGEIVNIKELKAPKPKFKDGVNKEYLILVKNKNNEEKVYKTLHVRPCVDVGDTIEIGDILGTTIRNGYFAYWSSPHIHLEIRPSTDAIRARGSAPFDLLFGKEDNNIKNSKNVKTKKLNKIPIKVKKILPEFLLASLPLSHYLYLDPFYGVKGSVGKKVCMLDGGMPIYKNGIIIFRENEKHPNSNSVYFGSRQIGILKSIRKRLGFFDFNDIKFFLDEREIRGISLFLANFKPLIKIIPIKKNSFSFKMNSRHYLTIETKKNS